MPIRRLLKNAALGPEEVTTIITAFEGACKALGLMTAMTPLSRWLPRPFSVPPNMARAAPIKFNSAR